MHTNCSRLARAAAEALWRAEGCRGAPSEIHPHGDRAPAMLFAISMQAWQRRGFQRAAAGIGSYPQSQTLSRNDASYKSFGVKPVLFPIRASIFGPISSRSWNAKTTSGQPGRERTRCDPWDSRLIVQPMRNNADNTLRALAEPHWLMRLQPRKLSQSPETFRHARSAQQEHAAPELQRATLLLHEYPRKPSLLVFGESPRSIGHLSPVRSR
jgi:hypothetical protein